MYFHIWRVKNRSTVDLAFKVSIWTVEVEARRKRYIETTF